jgi:UDP:flavonoid glycosyltransferase YjiC (YdhE family)
VARLLLVTSGLSGILSTTAELARRLRTAGHEVHYASQRSVGERLAGTVKAFHQLTPATRKPAGDLRGKNTLMQFATGLLTFRRRRKMGLDRLHQAEFHRVLDAVRPDLILIEIELHAYVFTAHGRNLPYLLISPWFQNVSTPGLPPITSPVPPQMDSTLPPEETGVARAKARHRRAAFVEVGNDRASILSAYARKVGFPPAHLTTAGWPPPFTFTGVPTLHLVPPELEFNYSVPATAHYVGPVVSPLASAIPLSDPLNSHLENLRREGRNILYAVASSMGGDRPSSLGRLLATVGRRKDWALILSLAGGEVRQDVEWPENVFPFSWVSQRALLPRIDCCIHHAGINTINECLVAGVPMVVYSGGKHDQPGCAARLRFHRLAIVGTTSDTDREMERNIDRALSARWLHEKIENFSRDLRSPRRSNQLLQVVERYLPS